MPSMDIVNIASRPMVIVTPLVSAAVPYSLTKRAGVPSIEPPKRCCWIMQSSQMLHGNLVRIRVRVIVGLSLVGCVLVA